MEAKGIVVCGGKRTLFYFIYLLYERAVGQDCSGLIMTPAVVYSFYRSCRVQSPPSSLQAPPTSHSPPAPGRHPGRRLSPETDHWDRLDSQTRAKSREVLAEKNKLNRTSR